MEAFSCFQSSPSLLLRQTPFNSRNPRPRSSCNNLPRINLGCSRKRFDITKSHMFSVETASWMSRNAVEGSKLIGIGSLDAVTAKFELGLKGTPFNTIPVRKKCSRWRSVITGYQFVRTGSARASYPLIGFPLGSKFRRFHMSPLQMNSSRCRNVVARSELVGSGSPDAEYTLTEFRLGSKLRGIGFYTMTAVAAIFLFVVMVVSHPFVLLFDRYRRKTHHLIAKIWASLTVYPFIDVKFEGLENLPPMDTPAVYVSNHQSFLDIYALLILGRSFKFISKTSIFVIPVIGWAMFLLGLIPLRRMDTRSQLDCLKRCMDLLRKGASVCFFPEGTRSKDGKLGAFKKGAFSVAAKTGVSVVPITLMGTGKLMPPGKEGTLNIGSIKTVINKPIEGSNPDLLCDEAWNVIADDLVRHGYGVHRIK